MCEGTPPVFEKLWVNDLLQGLPWRATSARPVGGTDHINIRELRAALQHGLAEAGARRSLRLLMIQDSCGNGRLG